MDLREMYPPQKDSPSTYITGEIGTDDIYITVGSAEVLPQTVPFPLTLGFDRSVTETVMVTDLGNGNNQLTVQRGPAPLIWAAGTKCGRVWTSDDMSAMQFNIGVVAEQTDENSSDIEINAESAANAISTEVTRATNAENSLSTIKVDRSELTVLITDVQYVANSTTVSVTFTTYDANAKAVGQFIRYLPIASNDAIGLMTPEAYEELTQLRNDVYALQQQGGKFIGISFATYVDLDAYPIPDTISVGDFTYVLDDEGHFNATTRYIYNGINFEFAYVIEFDPVGLATSTTPGLVLSDSRSSNGKIFVEANGSMSLIGWNSVLRNILDYPKVTALTSDNVFVIDGSSGVKGIFANDLKNEMCPEVIRNLAPEMHRMIFRGKNLGSIITTAQRTAIQNGTFDDLFVGDYWVIDDFKWRIVDINYWLNCGDNRFLNNHLVIMPDSTINESEMNAYINTTTGGYVGSDMYNYGLVGIRLVINEIFGEALKTHRTMFVNSVTNGKPSGVAWYSSTVDLPNENNMYGSSIHSPHPASYDATNRQAQTIDKQQFALFAIKPSFIFISNTTQWLRDVISDESFASVGNSGYSNWCLSTVVLGIRPVFAIG